MIQFFRNFFQSKFGVVITLAFLAMIGLAFALSDVGKSGTFGSISGGDKVAVVGDSQIDAADLTATVTSELERVRAQDPTMSMERFAAQGGIADVLKQMVSRWAMAEFADDFGLRAGKRLVDSEIASNPQLRGPDGNFSQDIFRQALRQQGISETAVRQDLAQQLLSRQLLMAAGYGAQMPASIARRYAGLEAEQRKGRLGAFPAGAYAPTAPPTDAQLQAFYTANRADFIRPERRVLRYASFGEAALTDLPAPTAAQIAARYQRDIATYRPREKRSFVQLILPTQAAAQAVVNEVNGGIALEASARAKGLATAIIAATDKQALTASASAAVANAAFASARGTLAAPAQGNLGWYVMRVETVEREAGQTLAQASSSIAQTLATEQRRTALNEKTAQLEGELAGGRSLSEVAAELGLTLQTTRPLTAAGRIYGTNETAPQALAPVFALAFEMDEGEPQLAETVAGETFIIFDVAEITASATAPLAEIREDAIVAWRRDRGMALAAEGAQRVIGRMHDGQTMAAAMAAEGKTLPPSQPVDMNRRELAALARQQQQLPPVLTLLFSMAEGTVKSLAQQSNLSWFVLQLDDITPPTLAADDATVAAIATSLGEVAGSEYADQLVKSIEDGLEVETNQTQLDAVIAQLTGRTN